MIPDFLDGQAVSIAVRSVGKVYYDRISKVIGIRPDGVPVNKSAPANLPRICCWGGGSDNTPSLWLGLLFLLDGLVIKGFLLPAKGSTKLIDGSCRSLGLDKGPCCWALHSGGKRLGNNLLKTSQLLFLLVRGSWGAEAPYRPYLDTYEATVPGNRLADWLIASAS